MWKAIFAMLAIFTPMIASGESQQSAAQLKVGLILPLTGPLAEYGQAVQNGIKLAGQDSPDVKRNCNFMVEDSKYDPKTAVAAFQKLTSIESVRVIYNWGGPTSDAVAPLTDHKDVVTFVWSADPKVAEGRQKVIRFSNSGADYGGTLAQYLMKKGYRKVGIVKTENQYIEAILDGFQNASSDKIDIEIVDSFQPSETDFRPTITKVKNRQFDSLGVFLLSGQVSNFINQLRTQQVTLPIFGTDFFESMTEVKQSNGGMVNAIFANNQVTSEFRQVYTKSFGNDLQINHAASGYDFAVFICKNLKPNFKVNSAQEILAQTMALTTFVGKQGTALFTKSARGDKYFRFPVVIRRITADEIVTEK